MRVMGLLLLALMLPACTAPSSAPPDDSASEMTSDDALAAALERAGTNRPEIERYLAHYERDADVERRLAARWVVANMPGHGFAKMALKRADGSIVPFEATDHPNLAAAQARLDDLAANEGALSFGLEQFTEDLRVMSAEQLIDNHERAFASWRTAPWSGSIRFSTFLEHILPYRGSGEALDLSWRAEANERLAPALAALRADLGRDPTLAEATRAALKASKKWVKFRQLYYLHPTDLSWSEMKSSKEGRCEDQSNAAVFAARSIGTVVAGDFTPYWADRDNNHAWEVVLDADGVGSARLAHRPAKVYRRMFGVQPASLGAMRRPGEPIPSGLGERNLLDVTRQYVDVADVTIELGPPPKGDRFAYLCVFNAGAWRPVHHAIVESSAHAETGIARFSDMGCNVLYLPAWHSQDGIIAAGAPFILGADGSRTTLGPGAAHQTPGLETVSLEASAGQELHVWSCELGQWTTLPCPPRTPGASVLVVDVPMDGLFWFRDPKGRGLERPFTVNAGSVHRW